MYLHRCVGTLVYFYECVCEFCVQLYSCVRNLYAVLIVCTKFEFSFIRILEIFLHLDLYTYSYARNTCTLILICAKYFYTYTHMRDIFIHIYSYGRNTFKLILIQTKYFYTYNRFGEILTHLHSCAKFVRSYTRGREIWKQFKTPLNNLALCSSVHT